MLGFSLYLNQDENYIEEKINEFKNFDILFTSMHYPVDDRNMKKLIFLKALADSLNIDICLDINGEILKHYPELLRMGLILRLDFGFDKEKIVNLSKNNRIAIIASSVSRETLEAIKELGGNFSNISAWHNYYPLEFSGLGEDDFIEKNKVLEKFGLDLFAFFQGDKDFRGPLYKSLPSLEEDRFKDPYYSYLKLKRFYKINNLVLSEGLSMKNKGYIEAFEKKGIINLDLYLKKGYEINEFKVRSDISKYIIRNERTYKFINEVSNNYIRKGDFLILNKNSGRYSGELEIARLDLGLSNSRNVIGRVCKEHLAILDLIKGDDRIAINRK
ncbi:MupG family TIM beta-alpha barrel fold protein [Anaerococcus porci]|uniref:MupG family TIM beta-alpha barrel fold protein n=1 Tax=Anaerococcus porci TaxID=2652269 RepID=UPI002A76101D|nr:MupG family TIM beta-alpha barrel fold protein [Anaerococcus porci]MDY3006042.1 MupG family TIM beta-alpha barrel fold protein [Anaerococcus porci]